MTVRNRRYAELAAAIFGFVIMPDIILSDDASLWIELIVGAVCAGVLLFLVSRFAPASDDPEGPGTSS